MGATLPKRLVRNRSGALCNRCCCSVIIHLLFPLVGSLLQSPWLMRPTSGDSRCDVFCWYATAAVHFRKDCYSLLSNVLFPLVSCSSGSPWLMKPISGDSRCDVFVRNATVASCMLSSLIKHLQLLWQGVIHKCVIHGWMLLMRRLNATCVVVGSSASRLLINVLVFLYLLVLELAVMHY